MTKMSLSLNYGILIKYDSLYELHYSGKGWGADITADANTIRSLAQDLKSSAQSNIDYLNNFINIIRSGGAVGECNKTPYMAQSTPEKVIEACNLYQGGFKRFYTIEDLENQKTPYIKMIEDANAILSFVPPPAQPPPPAPPPKPCGKILSYSLIYAIQENGIVKEYTASINDIKVNRPHWAKIQVTNTGDAGNLSIGVIDVTANSGLAVQDVYFNKGETKWVKVGHFLFEQTGSRKLKLYAGAITDSQWCGTEVQVNITVTPLEQPPPPPPPPPPVLKGKLNIRARLDLTQYINVPVTVNGLSGTTPATFELNPGTYTIKGTSYQGKVVTKTVTIREGETVDEILDFFTPTGTLSIKSNLDNLPISIPVTVSGLGTSTTVTTPATLTLKIGTYTITGQHLDMTKTITATVEENKTTTVSLNFVTPTPPPVEEKPPPVEKPKYAWTFPIITLIKQMIEKILSRKV